MAQLYESRYIFFLLKMFLVLSMSFIRSQKKTVFWLAEGFPQPLVSHMDLVVPMRLL